MGARRQRAGASSCLRASGSLAGSPMQQVTTAGSNCYSATAHEARHTPHAARRTGQERDRCDTCVKIARGTRAHRVDGAVHEFLVVIAALHLVDSNDGDTAANVGTGCLQLEVFFRELNEQTKLTNTLKGRRSGSRTDQASTRSCRCVTRRRGERRKVGVRGCQLWCACVEAVLRPGSVQ